MFDFKLLELVNLNGVQDNWKEYGDGIRREKYDGVERHGKENN